MRHGAKAVAVASLPRCVELSSPIGRLVMPSGALQAATTRAASAFAAAEAPASVTRSAYREEPGTASVPAHCQPVAGTFLSVLRGCRHGMDCLRGRA